MKRNRLIDEKIKGSKAKHLIENIPNKAMQTLSYILLSTIILTLLVTLSIKTTPPIRINIIIESDKLGIINSMAYIPYKEIIESNMVPIYYIETTYKNQIIKAKLNFKNGSSYIYDKNKYWLIDIELKNNPQIDAMERICLTQVIFLPKRSLLEWIIQRFKHIEYI